MIIGWQEIIVLGFIGLAVWLLIRRALDKKPGANKSCCGGGCSASAAPGRVVEIQELHTIDVQRTALTEPDRESSVSPRSDGPPRE